MNKLSLLFFCLLGLAGCQPSQPEVNFDELDEAAKRLPENAIHSMEAAEGTEITLFAHEPMLINPTNIHVDEYGRVWVNEALNYRNSYNPENPEREAGDRILVLEDTDQDGKADKRTVFYQGTDVNAALGIWAVGNRAIVSCSPNVLILTDTDGDLRADHKDTLFTGLGGLQTDHAVHAFVLGSDGRYYFNFGNTGGQILDKHGNLLTDPAGQPVTDAGQPYRQGMAFRCDPDGSNLEVLGHNFRNNYELAVDSYGTIWQSDNDDDGNRGVRINYLMEYGNYGYVDEKTGAGWREHRINMEAEIPRRHWHLNDPGVVPNLLHTGSGSPCGIAIYESDVLPSVFQNQILHAEAGHNVVRAYPVEKDGAGYKAKVIDLVKSKDQWFRPSDVCVAPDGSVFIADWYDPAVGGHKFGDPERGRIYRVTAKEQGAAYSSPTCNFSSPDGAAEALKSPNLAVRARAMARLTEAGAAAEKELLKLWQSSGLRLQARALSLLAKIEGKAEQYVQLALQDEVPDIRITGLRLARQLLPEKLPRFIKQIVEDPSPQVRREAAIALRRLNTPEADQLWAQLALQHEGGDRWYLEALGIGADLFPDSRFAAWQALTDENWNTAAGRDIVWRMRAPAALPLLKEMILKPEASPFELRQYLRAFDFHETADKNEILTSLLNQDHPLRDSINQWVIYQLDKDYVKNSPKAIAVAEEILPGLYGSQEYLDMVDKLGLKSQRRELLRMLLGHKEENLRRKAALLLASMEGLPLVLKAFKSAEEEKALRLLSAMQPIESEELYPFYLEQLADTSRSMALRRAALNSLASTWHGQIFLMEKVEQEAIPAAFVQQALLALSNSWNTDVRQASRALLAEKQEESGVELPPLAVLENLSGSVEKGKEVFGMFCANCHVAGAEGIAFGPALTEIGSKMGKNGLYQAIIYPSSGINFGYEGHTIRLKDGSTLTGIIESQTDKATTLRMMGGFTRQLASEEIARIEEMPNSLMTEGLHRAIGKEGLVDLVEYLSSQKAAPGNLSNVE